MAIQLIDLAEGRWAWSFAMWLRSSPSRRRRSWRVSSSSLVSALVRAALSPIVQCLILRRMPHSINPTFPISSALAGLARHRTGGGRGASAYGSRFLSPPVRITDGMTKGWRKAMSPATWACIAHPGGAPRLSLLSDLRPGRSSAGRPSGRAPPATASARPRRYDLPPGRSPDGARRLFASSHPIGADLATGRPRAREQAAGERPHRACAPRSMVLRSPRWSSSRPSLSATGGATLVRLDRHSPGYDAECSYVTGRHAGAVRQRSRWRPRHLTS